MVVIIKHYPVKFELTFNGFINKLQNSLIPINDNNKNNNLYLYSKYTNINYNSLYITRKYKCENKKVNV